MRKILSGFHNRLACFVPAKKLAAFHAFWAILLLTGLSACIDPFNIEDEVKGSSLLVVDGMITSQPVPYQVTLRYSSPGLKSYEATLVVGAQVSITDDEGNEALLQPATPGVYVSDPGGMQGQAGRTYQLHITTPDGKRYVSQPEQMQAVPAIDSIYAVLESRTYLSSLNEELEEWGMQIYLNTGSKTNQAGFYRWDWKDTYEFTAPLTLPAGLNPICWQSSRQIRYLNIAATQGLSQDVIERQPIAFVSKRGKKLMVRYSILITQYGLTRNAYHYWEQIQQQTESAGSVFDPPPSRIIGNVYNANDDNEQVLGYFQACAVTEKRFFIRRNEVPNKPGGPVSAFSECQPNFPDLPGYCYNCSLWPGATTERPAYW